MSQGQGAKQGGGVSTRGHSRRGATGSACKALTEHVSLWRVQPPACATDNKPAGGPIPEDQSGWTGRQACACLSPLLP